MNYKIVFSLAAMLLLGSCKNDEKTLNELADYNNSRLEKGYHFGDKIQLPKEISDEFESIAISFGNEEIKNLEITPAHFTLGDNAITFVLKTKSGEILNQDATINVFSKHPAKKINYQIVAEYPHNPANFIQGFQLEGNTVYESTGQMGASKIMKYTLGDTQPILSVPQNDDIFSEGSTIVGNKVYQLTWQNKKGFVYDKNTLAFQSEFAYPDMIGEGWGITYDGKNLLVSDGTKNIYFLNPNDPSKIIKYISVASDTEVYDQLNELEYHNGFLYANVWMKPIILKINPANGEVVAKIDLSKIVAENSKTNEDVLNGIAFKNENMLITGKNWSKIYEISLN